MDKLIQALKFYIKKFFGSDPRESESYCRIINERAFDRLISYLKDGKVVEGGTYHKSSKYLAPTIITDVNVDSPIMTNEIFGPILPIIPYQSLNDAIRFINSRPLPLALYCFTKDKDTAEQILLHTRSGGACVNDLLVHFTNSRLPFGGIGESGMGQYHSKSTFDTFTHQRAVVKSISTTLLDVPIRYPPYTPLKAFLADGLTSGRWIGYGSQVAKLCGFVGATAATYLYFNPPARL